MTDIRIPSHVSITFFDESAVLLNLKNNVYYALNDSGVDFWKAITQTGSFEAALSEVTKIYAQSSDVLREDMSSLFHSLLKAGLLEEAN